MTRSEQLIALALSCARKIEFARRIGADLARDQIERARRESGEEWQRAAQTASDTTRARVKAMQAEIARLRECVRNPWRVVACARGNGTLTGQFNIAREDVGAGRFGGPTNDAYPCWMHHGAGDFTRQDAERIVLKLNTALAKGPP